MEAELRRGAVQLVALTLLETPRYGYDLVRLLGEAGFDVEEGTLYPLLRRLEQQGILTSSWNTDGSRPRKYYRLTTLGSAQLTSLREEWRSFVESVDRLLEDDGETS